MAKRRKASMTSLSLKNPLVMYSLYGIAAYYGYNWYMGRPISIPFLSGDNANVGAYPVVYLP